MDKVRFGIIGTGGIGHHHLGYIHDLKRAELTAVCDIREDVVNAVAAKHNVKAFTDSRKLDRKSVV